MEFLQTLADNSGIPVVTAFILGLLTAVSPCPLAANITAIGYIAKDMDRRGAIFMNGVLYTLGRMVAYSILGGILIAVVRKGVDTFFIQDGISRAGEWLFGPILIVCGLLMLLGDRLRFPEIKLLPSADGRRRNGALGSLLLGVLLALTFCPASGLIFFGMLIPMSVVEGEGYVLPVVYALATGIPVVIVAWVLAYCINGLGRFYDRMQTFRKWFGRVAAVLFIGTGVYYSLVNYGVV